jgi:predicted DNA-binding transcriptional regulator AlpA
MTLELVGIAEVAAMLGVTTARVHQITRDDPTFPEPVAVLAAGRIWQRSDVERWGKRTGRL